MYNLINAFRDKYLAAIILTLISFTATAQTLDTSRVRQAINANPGYDYIGIGTSRTLRPPQDTIRQAARDSGAISIKNGILYIWNGSVNKPYGKATQLTDSSFKVGDDTIVIRGTGGGIANLKNMGDGFRLAVAPDSIKTLMTSGTWLFLDTIGTPGKIRMGVDPQYTWGLNVNFSDQLYVDSSKVASLSALKDTAAALRAADGGGADSSTFSTNYRRDTAIANVRTEFLPLNLSTNETIDQNGNSVYFTGGGELKNDSIRITQSYSNPIVGSDSLVTFGNSITNGLNASIPDSNYASRTAAAFGVPLTNKGVSSTVAYQACASDLSYINPGHSAIVTFCIGLNDLRNNGGGTNMYRGIGNAYEAAMQNHFLSTYTSGTSCTRYGSWTTNYNAVVNSGGKTTTACYSSTAEDSLTLDVTATGIAIGIIGTAGNNGSAVIYIDGNKVDSFNTGQQTFATGTQYQSMGHYYTGYANTLHHVRVVRRGGSGFVLVDYIGGLVSASDMKPFIFVHIPHMDATGYSGGSATQAIIDAANDTLTARYNRAVAAGLNVYLAHTNDYYDATTTGGLSSDHIHPNNLGHGQIFTAIYNSVFTSKSYPGTIAYSNDGHFYGAYTDSTRKQIAYTTEITLQKVLTNGSNLPASNIITGTSILDFSGFSRLGINEFKVSNSNTAYMHGTLGVQGSLGGVFVGSRTSDSTKGYIYYGTSGSTFLYDTYNSRNQIRYDTSMRMAIYNNPVTGSFTTPSATIHIGGNTNGAAGHAPLKIGKSIWLGTPEAYALENDSLYMGWTNGGGVRDTVAMRAWVRALVPHMIDSSFSDISNSVTSETTIDSTNVGANTLTINGQALDFEITGTYSDITASAQLKVYFAGNTLIDPGALPISSAPSTFHIKGHIIRTGTATAKCYAELVSGGTSSQPISMNNASLTGLDFTAANVFKFTAQASGAGGGTGDITGTDYRLSFTPSK